MPVNHRLLTSAATSLLAITVVATAVMLGSVISSGAYADGNPLQIANAQSPPSPSSQVSWRRSAQRILITDQSKLSFEDRWVGGDRLVKLYGRFDNNKLNILFMPDQFGTTNVDSAAYLDFASEFINQVFSIEPFSSQQNQFNIFALAPALSFNFHCYSDYYRLAERVPPCDDQNIRAAIDATIEKFGLDMQETIVIVKSDITQGYGLQDRDQPVSRYSYSMITTMFLLNPIPMGRHEFSHQFANLADGYSASMTYEAMPNPGYYVNCQPESVLSGLWRTIPGFTGNGFAGCGATERLATGRDRFVNFTRSYRDSQYGISTGPLSRPPYEFGPVERFYVERAILQGPSRYR